MKVIILAAGKGTRMKSDMSKVMHKVGGKPVINYILDSVHSLGSEEIFVVIGHQADKIKDSLKNEEKNIRYVLQEQQLGTGHAVMQVEQHLNECDEEEVLVLPGDCPLISANTLKQLFLKHREENAIVSILTTELPEPASYGRILRDEVGSVMGIREAKDCTKDQLNIKEINTGIYLFKCSSLFEAIKEINTNNKQKEYYLTDVIEIVKNQRKTVTAFCTKNNEEIIGINSRADLALVNKYLYKSTNKRLMEEGVTILDPETTFIDSSVKIGNDTVISPFTVIKGKTEIGKRCEIGSHCFIEDKILKEGTVVSAFTKL
jgi:bifunctional UDP-N-acetylglucosamine pyrophosphorylase / glucosamine-1-phosphate N-acetyltransferase